jgi:predicted nucleic acid-binding protein
MTSKIAVIDASIAIKATLPNPLQGHCRALGQPLLMFSPLLLFFGLMKRLQRYPKLIISNSSQKTKAVGHWAYNSFFQILSRIVARLVEHWNSGAAYDSFYLVLAQALDCDFWPADKNYSTH